MQFGYFWIKYTHMSAFCLFSKDRLGVVIFRTELRCLLLSSCCSDAREEHGSVIFYRENVYHRVSTNISLLMDFFSLFFSFTQSINWPKLKIWHTDVLKWAAEMLMRHCFTVLISKLHWGHVSNNETHFLRRTSWITLKRSLDKNEFRSKGPWEILLYPIKALSPQHGLTW